MTVQGGVCGDWLACMDVDRLACKEVGIGSHAETAMGSGARVHWHGFGILDGSSRSQFPVRLRKNASCGKPLGCMDGDRTACKEASVWTG